MLDVTDVSKTYRGKKTCWIWDANVPLHEWAERAPNVQAKNDQAFKLYTAALDLHGPLGAIGTRTAK